MEGVGGLMVNNNQGAAGIGGAGVEK